MIDRNEPRATPRIVLWLSRTLIALLLALAGSSAALAQGNRPVPLPAALTQITVASDTPGETHFVLNFEPRANTSATIGTDPTQPTLGFALSGKRPNVGSPQGLKGLVRSISFDQADTILILRFNTTQRATVTALPIDDHNVAVTVSNGAAKATDSQAVTQTVVGQLPAASNPPPGEDGFELVPLKYADVSEVVGLLTEGVTVKSNDLFLPREPAFGSNSLTGSSYNPGPTSQAPGSDDQPLGQSVDASIAIDRRLNAIWLKGSPERIARLKAMIAAIDIPLDSVILETQFLELTENGARAIGIDFTNANGQIAAAQISSGTFIGIGQLSETPVKSFSVQAAINAQVTKGQARILSRPRISAQSGSTAKIITGDALPILTAITLANVQAVSQQVQYVNVGVTLQIAPRVSSDGYVSSHVFCVVSSVTGTSQGYPTISQREAETSATVRDGDSFVIGGLTQEDFISTKGKIPGLGDIPLLGNLFHNDRRTTAKTELYIVVTPHIVRRVGLNSPAANAPPPGNGVQF